MVDASRLMGCTALPLEQVRVLQKEQQKAHGVEPSSFSVFPFRLFEENHRVPSDVVTGVREIVGFILLGCGQSIS